MVTTGLAVAVVARISFLINFYQMVVLSGNDALRTGVGSVLGAGVVVGGAEIVGVVVGCSSGSASHAHFDTW